jgi:hypothetical protein
MIYGLGVLDDCLPFLVIRVRQVTEIGRSYAYSLLLDPGRDVWVRFDWNAADLLRAILEDKVRRESLLLRPESLTTENLDQQLHRLTPLQTSTSHGPSQSAELFEQWVGAAFSNEPVILTPSALGFTERPKHQQLIEQLYQFPQPCFRVGGGWLVGASGEHAAALGAHLVIDDQLDSEAGSSADNAERGRQATGAWLTISQHDEFKDALLRFEGVPFCEWEEAKGASSAALFSRLKLLAELLKGDRLPDQLQALEQQFKDFPFLAVEIRHAAHSLVFRGKGSLSAIETAVALRNLHEQGLKIPADRVSDLDPERLIQIVVDREVERRKASSALALPSPTAPTALPLPPQVEAEVFVRLLGKIPPDSDIPKLLIEASAFMSKHFNRSQRAVWLTKLKETAERRIKLTDGPLSLWDTFPKDHVLWQDLSEILKKVVWIRAKTPHPDWELEYLRFGKDPGGMQLSHIGIESSKASQLVDCYLKEVRNQTDLAPLAKEWLTQLAHSPLRLSVTIDRKVAIAESHISESWLPFLRLWEAYNDWPASGELDPVVGNKQSKIEERIRLGQESLQMLRTNPPRTKAPDLQRLVTLLINPPMDFYKELCKFQRQLGTAAFSLWIQRLRDVNEEELAAKETVLFIKESKERLPEDWLFRGFKEDSLEGLVDYLIFGGFAIDDALYRSRCEEILGTQQHWPRLRDTVAKICKSSLNDREKLENFVRRYGGHEPVLVRLFACFLPTLKQDMVTELALRDTEEFIKQAREIIEKTERGERLNNYRYAVLKYVRTCDLEAKDKLLSWSLFTKSGLDGWIDKILETEKKLVDKNPADELKEDESSSPERSLYSTAQVSTAATSSVGKSSDAQHPDDRESQEESPRKTRRGLRQKVRSLFSSVFSAEPPPELNPEESGSTASHVKKDDS